MKLILLLLLTLSIESLNDSVQEKILSLMEKIEKLENEVNELRQWKENELNKKKKKYDLKSDIIKEKGFIEILYNRLEQNLYIKNKHFHLKRIYTSEKDGIYLKDLYTKCDGQKMILLAVENIAGYKFGGFIQDFKIEDENAYCIDLYGDNNEDFIFSIDNNRIYNSIYTYNLKDTHKSNNAHININKSFLYFNSALKLSESGNSSFLNSCKCEKTSNGLFYWGGYRPFVEDKYSLNSNAKIVEAFQVIFDIDE